MIAIFRSCKHDAFWRRQMNECEIMWKKIILTPDWWATAFGGSSGQGPSHMLTSATNAFRQWSGGRALSGPVFAGGFQDAAALRSAPWECHPCCCELLRIKKYKSKMFFSLIYHPRKQIRSASYYNLPDFSISKLSSRLGLSKISIFEKIWWKPMERLALISLIWQNL